MRMASTKSGSGTRSKAVQADTAATSGPIVSSAHLVSPQSAEMSEFEFGLIVAGNAFHRWVIHCMAAAGLTDDGMAEMIGSLEKAHGFTAVHKFFAALGAPMAEAPAHGLGTPPGVQAKSFYDKSNMNP
mgnify:CR=1 FL=1